MTKQINDSMASIENNAPKNSTNEPKAVQKLYVEHTSNHLKLNTEGDTPYIVRENGYWKCVVAGNPNANEAYEVLIPFANTESWREDVIELFPTADVNRISLYTVFVGRYYDEKGRVHYFPSYVQDEHLACTDSMSSVRVLRNSTNKYQATQDEKKILSVRFHSNRFHFDHSENSEIGVRENGFWYSAIEGNPNDVRFDEDAEDKYRILIPFADLASWRNDVTELFHSADMSRVALYKIHIIRYYDEHGTLIYLPAYVLMEKMEQEPSSIATSGDNEKEEEPMEMPF